MERAALQELIVWNNRKNRKPLIIWGARQVGKTYLVRELFAENYYKNNYLYIDFSIEKAIGSYCTSHVSAKEIVAFLAASKNKRIDENTLLIFDEVQECPAVVTALKSFCQDMRQIPVIATGSMVRIRIQRYNNARGVHRPFLFPVGKINQLTVYPMSFDEFLLNYNAVFYAQVEKAYREKTALSEEMHNIAMDAVYRYLLLGGMPEAVQTYLDTESFYESRLILKDLYDNYLSDMQLYQASPEAVVRSRRIFESIYRQLNKESKNFKSGVIEVGARTRDMRTPIDWLTMAHVVNQSFQLSEHVTLPLIAEEGASFRLFLGDIGMFAYQSGVNSASFISNDRENTLAGIFFENFIADELTAKGIPLYYWKGKNTAELEFLVESDNALYPIDVKKGRGSLNSLQKFSDHNRYACAIKVSRNRYGYDASKKLMTLPFYFFPFAARDLAAGAFTPPV